MPEEKRIDSADGESYTWDEINNHYWKKYKAWEVADYWENMKPVMRKASTR